MNEIDKLTQELDSLMGETEPEKRKRFDEVVARLKELNGPEVQEKMKPVVEHQLEYLRETRKELEEEVLRRRIGEKMYKLIPWSYIAQEYFGKSLSWLTQRINGYPVRGKVYTLNAEQKETLNRALSEIGEFIGSYRFA